MNFEEAMIRKEELEKINSEHSKVLRQFERNEMGLTPDSVRITSEWKDAKSNFDRSFSELRNFNAWFIKKFKKQYMENRRKRK